MRTSTPAEQHRAASGRRLPNIWESLAMRIDHDFSPANPDNALAISTKMFRTIRY
ncbi:hypothetical protein L810_1704 [Burkholderia sp. AU4i]|nr:hypothetical protein L810_1704 [Burkholderia sp. AU4i]